MAFKGHPVRVLTIPGLLDSGPAHWQSWLERQFKHSVRVKQEDWETPELDRWATGIDQTLACHRGTQWVAVAHSFGCLALARYLQRETQGICAAILVAPADPDKFGVVQLLPHAALPVPSVLIGSGNDPWMRIESARAWAKVWRSQFINFGGAGHINTESGFGPLPPVKTLVNLMIHRIERSRRLGRAHALELSFAI